MGVSKPFFQTYRTHIISTLLTILIGGAIPTVVWMHNAYADERYTKKDDALLIEIQQIDNALFEIAQEISFAPAGSQVREKFIARQKYYENLKAAKKEQLQSLRNNQ